MSEWGGTSWYLVVLGQYNLVLLGIKCYWVRKGLLANRPWKAEMSNYDAGTGVFLCESIIFVTVLSLNEQFQMSMSEHISQW